MRGWDGGGGEVGEVRGAGGGGQDEGCGGGRVAGQVKEGAVLAATERGCGSSGRRRGDTCRRRRRDTPPRDTPPPAARTLQHHRYHILHTYTATASYNTHHTDQKAL